MTMDNPSTIADKQKLPGEKLILPGTTIGGEVGTLYVDFVLWDMEKTRSHAVNGLVDTGASLTQVPASVLQELGILPVETQRFILADGSRREMQVGEARMELQGRFKVVEVIFGAEGSNVLLGALALENFGLAADARNGRLIPADFTL